MSKKGSGAAAHRLLYIAATVALILVVVIVTYSSGRSVPFWRELFSRQDGEIETVQPEDSAITAYFFDVGEGDCALFVCGGKTLLVDSGEKDYAGKVVGSISDLGVTRLDYIVGTHGHSDHIGGLAVIMKKFDFGEVILGDTSIASHPSYLGILDELSRHGSEPVEAKAGYRFMLGDAVCEIVAPRDVRDPDSEENDRSIVLTVTLDKMTYLLMGDAEEREEEQILEDYPNLSANVIKIAHHGSDTSSSMRFLKTVAPGTAVISCGDAKRYSHPSEKTVNTLDSLGISYYTTSDCGTITVRSDGSSYTIQNDK